ncbi:DUF7344 domain-containing protein [Natrinema longum]|uniref:DUF7344 domain-containing protein n=1 Tax=Natrinema longum TaxID=370324 RepID=A0A8A2UCW0_9EURY|nr:hypothetical protein [Natrinema longum]MBZ6495495.1 hypothetical protein [Natrinema longum]QSW86536.1 hypothetical protein J0X27_06895 [Natrinema longum]
MNQIYDELFEALANERRRRILFELVDQNSQSEAPVHIDAPPDRTDTRQAVDIELYHVHLPKLDDYGFVDWNRNTSAVEPGERFADIRPVLERLRGQRPEATVKFV